MMMMMMVMMMTTTTTTTISVVCSLGLTPAQLLATWKNEAEFACRLRNAGKLHVELFKVVAQREVSTVFVTACTKLLYKPMTKVMGKGDFRPLTATKPLILF